MRASPRTQHTLDDLENNTLMASIPWRQPVKVNWPGGKWDGSDFTVAGVNMFACRVCIANHGLKFDSPHQWPTMADAEHHVATAHT